MRRLYFLLPDVQSCRSTVSDLQAEGIPTHHLHVVASATLPLDGLPEATSAQTSELTHGLEAGLGVGGVAGLLGGLLAVTFPPAGLILGGGAILASTVAGAGFGALVSTLVARDVPSHELERFEEAIARGQVLLMVDVPRREVGRWQDWLQERHPEAEIRVANPG